MAAISGILNTNPENVIGLLRQINAKQARPNITTLGDTKHPDTATLTTIPPYTATTTTTPGSTAPPPQAPPTFNASADPQDLGGPKQPPPPPGASSSMYDLEIL